MLLIFCILTFVILLLSCLFIQIEESKKECSVFFIVGLIIFSVSIILQALQLLDYVAGYGRDYNSEIGLFFLGLSGIVYIIDAVLGWPAK